MLLEEDRAYGKPEMQIMKKQCPNRSHFCTQVKKKSANSVSGLARSDRLYLLNRLR